VIECDVLAPKSLTSGLKIGIVVLPMPVSGSKEGISSAMHGMAVAKENEIEGERPEQNGRFLVKVSQGLAALVGWARGVLSRANMQSVPRPGDRFLRVEGSKHF
jgi:hypothetical protein